MKKIVWGIVGAILIFGIFLWGMLMNKQNNDVVVNKIVASQAVYRPGDQVEVTILLTDEEKTNQGTYQLKVTHLGEEVAQQTANWETSNGKGQLNIQWQPPQTDFTGYLLQIKIKNQAGKTITNINKAIDVSSNWTKFPRYGYLTDFSDNATPEKTIEQMKNWQLNSIEYYDWKFLHHQLVPQDGSMTWQDWSGRQIDGNKVKEYIRLAKEQNIVNMSYNMVYGATNNYKKYGIKDEWLLHYAEDHGEAGKRPGDVFTFKMGASPTGQSNLFFFDLDNSEWQDYIIKKNKEALEVMGFDGWHGDTVGEWGKMWTTAEVGQEDKAKYVKDSYQSFLNTVKKRLGNKYYLSFNPVGAQGIEQVNASNVDVLYAEIWPWDKDSEGNTYDDYMSLKREIDQSRKESQGKSLIIPAYMEYDYAAAQGKRQPFNEAAVLLTDAAVYAAGGSRMELGNGTDMLSNEYFPSNKLYMTKDHQARQHALQEFIVAYQNILRDGLEDNQKIVQITNERTSTDGQPDTIWAYAKEKKGIEAIQLINLSGVKDVTWRANEGQKATPNKKEKLTVRYYTENDYQHAYLTSPDPDFDSRSKVVAMTRGKDSKGKYLEVPVSSLEYWDMIYFQ
ncbi:glycoside hydrolase family 66 protein [Enterococcus italicus]|uniref:glycoside hydrolase family 66 protein n=1 Tax=Enterococcus italicus TaxID=246144 RepID=UPI0028A76D3A|nr:glycoside hydrolase family 66 protein [Enterococcus italicus]